MWELAQTEVTGGWKYQVAENGAWISFRKFFGLVDSNLEFVDWYSRTLAASEAPAFYWELPPLTNSTIDDDFEFVLIDAPALARQTPDPTPFASLFARENGKNVIVFPNLGGDAILVAPAPHNTDERYSHLAAFLREGSAVRIRALWQITARTMLDRLGDNPIWLSTSGLGVAWPHLRLDSRPKYYQHRPYAQTQ